MNQYSFSTIKEIVSPYELLIIDLWGVIHDGNHLYPGAEQTIEYLHSIGKKIVFLSNAPRRAEHTRRQLIDFGIGPDLYERVITSGELAFEYLSKARRGKSSEQYETYFYIGSEKDQDVLEGSGLTRVRNMQEAKLVIATGFEIGEDQDVKDKYLKEAVKENLPMFCLNPDLEIHKHDGRIHYCAGILAKRYKQLGGRVKFFGKPEAATYKRILDSFSVPPEKILCIGDNIHTDIKGASKSKLDSALILWGIPAMYLTFNQAVPTNQSLHKFLKKEISKPTHICLNFLL